MPDCPYLDAVIAHAFHQLPSDREPALQAHLAACSACRLKLNEIMETVGHLALAAPEAAPPPGLREKVIRRVTDEATRTAADTGTGRRRQVRMAPVWAAAAAVAVIAVVGSYTAIQVGNRLHPTAQTLRMVSLQGVGNPATGRVSFTREGTGVRITLEARGLTPLPSGEVYQLWLIKDGKRTSGGVFVADAAGGGVMSTWLPGEAPFDALGVTHEPDAFGSQPRGPKVLGSSS